MKKTSKILGTLILIVCLVSSTQAYIINTPNVNEDINYTLINNSIDDYVANIDDFDDTILLANVSDNRDLIGILEDNVSDNRDLIGAIDDFDDTILLANVSDNRDLIGAIVDFDDTVLLANVSDNSD